MSNVPPLPENLGEFETLVARLKLKHPEKWIWGPKDRRIDRSLVLALLFCHRMWCDIALTDRWVERDNSVVPRDSDLWRRRITHYKNPKRRPPEPIPTYIPILEKWFELGVEAADFSKVIQYFQEELLNRVLYHLDDADVSGPWLGWGLVEFDEDFEPTTCHINQIHVLFNDAIPAGMSSELGEQET